DIGPCSPIRGQGFQRPRQCVRHGAGTRIAEQEGFPRIARRYEKRYPETIRSSARKAAFHGPRPGAIQFCCTYHPVRPSRHAVRYTRCDRREAVQKPETGKLQDSSRTGKLQGENLRKGSGREENGKAAPRRETCGQRPAQSGNFTLTVS